MVFFTFPLSNHMQYFNHLPSLLILDHQIGKLAQKRSYLANIKRMGLKLKKL